MDEITYKYARVITDDCVDSALSSTSENPVQNKAIAQALSQLSQNIGNNNGNNGTTVVANNGQPTSSTLSTLKIGDINYSLPQGEMGPMGPQGEQGPAGMDGANGQDGHSPVINIGENGHWFIDGVDTNVQAEVISGTVVSSIGGLSGTVTTGTGLTAASNTLSVTGVEYKILENGTLTVAANPLKFVRCTQNEYDLLVNKDENTFYIVVEEEE